MTDAKLHILQHSLGLDQYGRGSMYRNHFVTGEGSIDFPYCVELVAEGLMTRSTGSSLTGGDELFRVTEAGKRFAVEHSPAPPKLSRSKSRYASYLDDESDLPFGEWLKLRRYAPDAWQAVSAPRTGFIYDDVVPF